MIILHDAEITIKGKNASGKVLRLNTQTKEIEVKACSDEEAWSYEVFSPLVMKPKTYILSAKLRSTDEGHVYSLTELSRTVTNTKMVSIYNESGISTAELIKAFNIPLDHQLKVSDDFARDAKVYEFTWAEEVEL